MNPQYAEAENLLLPFMHVLQGRKFVTKGQARPDAVALLGLPADADLETLTRTYREVYERAKGLQGSEPRASTALRQALEIYRPLTESTALWREYATSVTVTAAPAYSLSASGAAPAPASAAPARKSLAIVAVSLVALAAVAGAFVFRPTHTVVKTVNREVPVPGPVRYKVDPESERKASMAFFDTQFRHITDELKYASSKIISVQQRKMHRRRAISMSESILPKLKLELRKRKKGTYDYVSLIQFKHYASLFSGKPLPLENLVSEVRQLPNGSRKKQYERDVDLLRRMERGDFKW